MRSLFGENSRQGSARSIFSNKSKRSISRQRGRHYDNISDDIPFKPSERAQTEIAYTPDCEPTPKGAGATSEAVTEVVSNEKPRHVKEISIDFSEGQNKQAKKNSAAMGIEQNNGFVANKRMMFERKAKTSNPKSTSRTSGSPQSSTGNSSHHTSDPYSTSSGASKSSGKIHVIDEASDFRKSVDDDCSVESKDGAAATNTFDPPLPLASLPETNDDDHATSFSEDTPLSEYYRLHAKGKTVYGSDAQIAMKVDPLYAHNVFSDDEPSSASDVSSKITGPNRISSKRTTRTQVSEDGASSNSRFATSPETRPDLESTSVSDDPDEIQEADVGDQDKAMPSPSESYSVVSLSFLSPDVPTDVASKVFEEALRSTRSGGLIYVVDLDGETVRKVSKMKNMLCPVDDEDEQHLGEKDMYNNYVVARWMAIKT